MKHYSIKFLAILIFCLVGGSIILGRATRTQAHPQPLPVVATACSGSYCLNRHLLGGGIGPMTSASYGLRGTLGQMMAGLFSNDNYVFIAGYWGGLLQEQEMIYLPIVIK